MHLFYHRKYDVCIHLPLQGVSDSRGWDGEIQLHLDIAVSPAGTPERALTQLFSLFASRQDFTLWLRLILNSKVSCLSLLSTCEIIGISHHTPQKFLFVFVVCMHAGVVGLLHVILGCEPRHAGQALTLQRSYTPRPMGSCLHGDAAFT